MKRTTTIIILFLIAGLLTSCSADQYTIEREHYKIQRLAEKIFKNPHASPPKQLEKVVNKLQKFANKHPKHALSFKAEFTIARLYIVKEDYEKGRIYLSSLINKYKKNENIAADALFLIGNSYEIEGKWNLALSQYKKIMQDNPLTLRGLNIPIYIAQHYKIKLQTSKMTVAFKEAASHYKALAVKYPDSPLGFKTYSLTAQCYLEIKNWPAAIKIFDIILSEYKDKMRVDGVLLNKAFVYKEKLKDNAKARQALETLIKDYPNSRLVEAAKKILNEVAE